MLAYHVTHKKNLKSILRRGIDPRRATGALPAVWLALDVTPDLRRKVAKRHGWKEQDLVALLVDVPRERCAAHHISTGHRDTGFYTGFTVTPENISY